MVEIQKVETRDQVKQFHRFARSLYANDPEFVSHLDLDVDAVFDPEKNLNFEGGDAERWLAFKSGEVVGKVAAFYNAQQSGIGFFDSINDKEVAHTLFDTASDWLRAHGQRHVQAPINFGERDRYWGLMVDGFKRPSYQENYNFPYYQELFESYGFSKDFEQTTSEVSVDGVTERMSRYVQRAKKDQQFRAVHYSRSDHKRFVRDFSRAYNEAWGDKEFFIPLTEKRVEDLFSGMRPILRPDLLWFLYDGDRCVAFYFSVIDVNQIFRHLKGKLNWWAKLKFMILKRTIRVDRVRGIVFGVVPEYQNKGIYSKLIISLYEVLKNDAYVKSSELSWIGSFNPRMHALFRSLNAVKTKLHFTYTKEL